MSNENPIYMQDDKVYYVGTNERIKSALTSKEGKPQIGFIHARVVNVPDTFVVEFPDTKEGDSYIIAASSLSKYRPPADKKHEGPEVQTRRRKREDSE